MLNISSNGAGIHLLSPETAPSKAVLHLPDGIVREAILRWQREAFAGYEFCKPEQPCDAGVSASVH
ncbi:hypothetical protein [Sabulicella glaciei]|uniref:PilZ domain-containing protein n=1 Tax=Sabulicella glaciei TaxID=2984948 RepID=A0ABT3P1M8_9PROT|nr:hypothetical protein [Roseococcus sp. MDT2-1-1]MCW8088323.1 hypothetical protein [Roseococcus sp. MDT2-1-1]